MGRGSLPNYDYECSTNGLVVEVYHGIHQKITTWGELCEISGHPLGDTPANTAVKKVITAPGLSFPKTKSALKNMGFTKLVKRDKGVYENITATGNESRYVKADQPNTFPDFKKKIGD